MSVRINSLRASIVCPWRYLQAGRATAEGLCYPGRAPCIRACDVRASSVGMKSATFGLFTPSLPKSPRARELAGCQTVHSGLSQDGECDVGSVPSSSSQVIYDSHVRQQIRNGAKGVCYNVNKRTLSLKGIITCVITK